MKTKKEYSAKGIVVGNLWGGGRGGYSTEPLRNYKSLKTLLIDANRMLIDGSLDSGMGFESLECAILNVKETETIFDDNKEYTRDTYTTEMIGIPSMNEEDFLQELFEHNYQELL